MLKISQLFLIFISLYLPFSGNVSGLADIQEQLIRVGISTSDFSQLEYSSTTITADSSFSITDLAQEKVLINGNAGAPYNISAGPAGFNIKSGGSIVLSNIQGPIGIESPDRAY
jgi:hypothetical protein